MGSGGNQRSSHGGNSPRAKGYSSASVSPPILVEEGSDDSCGWLVPRNFYSVFHKNPKRPPVNVLWFIAKWDTGGAHFHQTSLFFWISPELNRYWYAGALLAYVDSDLSLLPTRPPDVMNSYPYLKITIDESNPPTGWHSVHSLYVREYLENLGYTGDESVEDITTLNPYRKPSETISEVYNWFDANRPELVMSMQDLGMNQAPVIEIEKSRRVERRTPVYFGNLPVLEARNYLYQKPESEWLTLWDQRASEYIARFPLKNVDYQQGVFANEQFYGKIAGYKDTSFTQHYTELLGSSGATIGGVMTAPDRQKITESMSGGESGAGEYVDEWSSQSVFPVKENLRLATFDTVGVYIPWNCELDYRLSGEIRGSGYLVIYEKQSENVGVARFTEVSRVVPIVGGYPSELSELYMSSVRIVIRLIPAFQRYDMLEGSDPPLQVPELKRKIIKISKDAPFRSYAWIPFEEWINYPRYEDWYMNEIEIQIGIMSKSE